MNDLFAITVIDFINYCHSFYGSGGIYDMGATYKQILDATEVMAERRGMNVEFDSEDREDIRDILCDEMGLVFPEAPLKS